MRTPLSETTGGKTSDLKDIDYFLDCGSESSETTVCTTKSTSEYL